MSEGRERGRAAGEEGRVVELLPQATYRVETESRRQVLAHAAAASRRNYVRLRPGDRVRVEISSRDPRRGRITEVLEGPGRSG